MEKLMVTDVPHMIRMWDYERNTEKPEKVSARDSKQRFWKCPDCGYTWSTTPASRYHGLGKCPCHELNLVIKRGVNDVLTVVKGLPDILDSDNDFDAIALQGVGSTMSVNFKCRECGKKWRAQLLNQVAKLEDGSYAVISCKHLSLKCKRSVADVPHMLRMWDYERNIAIPESISAQEMKPRFWKCPGCGYAWSSSPKSRYNSSGKCPCHEANKVIVSGVNDVLTIVKGLSDFLSEDNDFAFISTQGINSTVDVNLWCRECGRKWSAHLSSQVRKNDGGYYAAGCPHYNTTCRKPDDVPFCTEVDKIIKFWDEKNPQDPSKTKSNSTEKVHFICKNCGYDWTTSVCVQAKSTGKCKCCELQLVAKKGITDVFTLVPESKKFYNFDKNRDVDVYSLSLTNSIDVLIDWKCPDCGYEWRRSLPSRIAGKKGSYSFKGCPKCNQRNGYRMISVAATPKLVKFWDFELNKDIDINLISRQSTSSAHWRCKECGYKWVSTIRGRNDSKIGCPACDGKRPIIQKGKTDILTLCPEIASIYDFEENEKKGIDIYSLGVHSTVVAHFKCRECEYEWYSPIHKRINNGKGSLVGCPNCKSGRYRKIPYSEQFPEWAEMYLSDLNDIPLDSIRGKEATFRQYHWKCLKCSRVFKATISSMSQSYRYSTRGCPFCSNTLLSEGKSFAELHPDLMDEYASENTDDPYKAFANSKKKVLWICKECGNRWTASFALRHTGGGKCPLCHRTALIKDANSFAAVYPDLKEYWSDSNDRRAEDVFYNSSEWFNFICPTCGEEFGAFIKDYISEENHHCPYCNGSKAKPGMNSLKARYPEIAKRWSSNNELDSDRVLPTWIYKAKWSCDICNGEYTAPIREVVGGGAECPYCKGTRVLPGYNSLKATYPERAKRWSPSNKLDSDHVLPTLVTQAKWICEVCHGEYVAPIREEVAGVAGCPYCSGSKVLPGYNSIKALFPEIARRWSGSNELDSDNVLPTLSYQAQWICDVCHGEYVAPIRDVVAGIDECPYCKGTKLLPGYNSFADRHPDLISELDELANYLLPVSPNEVSDNSTYKFWWICKNDKSHKYRMSPKNRLMFEKRGREPCLYCRGQRRKLNHFVTNIPDEKDRS